MNDDSLLARRDEFVRSGIPAEVYAKCVARANELRRAAFRDAAVGVIRLFGFRLSRNFREGGEMIIREWRGRSSLLSAEAYPRHFRDNVVHQLRRVEGFMGGQLVRRRLGNEYEFVVLTRWRSLEVVRGFAGADFDKAVVEPGAVATLSEFDTRVQHYEIVEEVSAP